MKNICVIRCMIDITELLSEGENVLGMYVGDGWYLGARSLPDIKKMRHAHAVLFQLELLYEDGTRDVIGSDGTVKVSYGPVQSSDLFDGELYDATKERQNWDCPGYSDTDWKSVKAVTYTMSNLRAQLGPPVTEVMTIPAGEVIHSPKGETIIDFGQTIAGRVRMKITAPKGTEVTLEHCEVLDKEGNYYNNIMSTSGGSDGCQQKDVYIADGTIAEYEPLFTFHGFRYVKIIGLENIRKEDFTAVVLSSEQENTGTFESSDVRLNRLYENTRWSQRSNMLSIPTDCPQREKAGWTGDIQIYASTALQNADLTAFLTRWLYNVSCDQGQYGEVPIVVPYDGPYPFMGKFIFRSPGKNSKSTSAGWGDAALLVPYQMYQITGNTEILKQQYNSMKKWCDYIIGQIENKKGKKKKLPEETEQYLWNTGFHFGEWLIPSLSTEGLGNNKGMQISLKETTKYTAPIFGWLSVSRFAEIARLLGRTADAERYNMAGNRMKEAISDGIIRSGGKMPAEWMGAYVLAIYFDLVPEQFKEYFASHLPELIEKNDGCLDTGFLATPYILDALCKIGRQDMAYELLWNEKQPSWMFEVEHGATTIWESWFAYNKDGAPTSVSMNHYAFGCVDDWIFRTVNGLDKEKAGFKKICICPKPDGRLTYAKRSFCSEYGTIVCNWEKKEEEFFLHVEIPCNTTATIVLPNGDTCETGSGNYEFSCKWNP